MKQVYKNQSTGTSKNNSVRNTAYKKNCSSSSYRNSTIKEESMMLGEGEGEGEDSEYRYGYCGGKQDLLLADIVN